MRLGAKGWRVTVIDRLDRAGGRGSSITQGGHRFDLGPTIVTVPDVFRDLWAATGNDFDRDVDLRPLDPFYTIRWPDGSHFAATSDTARMIAEVERLSPGDVEGYLRFLKDADRRFVVGYLGMVAKPMHRLWETVKVLPEFALLRADRSILGLARARVRDPRLQMALSFHPLFIGGDPMHVTSMYALVSHLEKEFGVHYAIGGVQAIADAMAKIVRKQGGTIRANTTVDRITLTATARRRDTGRRHPHPRRADRVQCRRRAHLSDADARPPPQTLDRCETDARPLVDGPLRLVLRHAWHAGPLARPWPPHHHVRPRYEGLLRDIFIKGKLADDHSLYIHRPSVTDPTVAPDGDDTFYVLSPVPNLGKGQVDWTREEPIYRDKIAATLETVMPGFRDRMVESLIFTPETFRDRYLSPLGAGFSLEPRILQSAWFRPHNVSEEAQGLYLVGAGTHPGAGLPGVVSSAKVLADLVPDAPATPALRMAAE